LLLAAGAAVLVLAAAGRLSSEQVSLSTYYPAPSGVYTNMITTGNTYLARDAGAVGVGMAAPREMQDGRSIALHVGRYAIANDVYLAAPVSGAPRWASQAGAPTLSPEYHLLRSGTSSISQSIGTHGACFVTGFRTWADDSNMYDGCRVVGEQNAPWMLVVSGNREDPSECRARCLDW
jgi:hypothetical protein